ncbi:sorting nexin-29 isoform X2 [Sipha flava]|nr:sorting nexin-29 isoform X2 [Sipha flava]
MAHVITSEAGKCERLQKNLLNSVKQCQKRFGSSSEIATEIDLEVANLCHCLEAILSHGMKSKTNAEDKSSLLKRQVSKIVTGLSDGDKSQNRLVPFWCFIKEILNEAEIQRFDSLANIKNDYGRGKAWLRASINERCLEKYMHLCIKNEKLINQYYEKWAFMSNSEKNSILPNTAAGLSSIVFALNIDKLEFNKDVLDLTLNEPIIDGDVDSVLKKESNGKIKKVKAKVINFDSSEDDIQTAEEVKSDEDVIMAVGDEATSISTSSYDKITGYFIGEFEDLPSTENELENRLRKLSPIEEMKAYEVFVPVSSLSPPCDTDDESKSIGSNDENNSLCKFDESKDHIFFLEKQYKENISELETKITDLIRENDLLKHQLRKYVSAVQLMKQDENESEEAKLYQQKLIQVAEMHSELIELNSRLNNTIIAKDHCITKLRTELVSLRGPLPSDEIPHTNIHLWVPSAFLVGRISDPHHVYQIHVRILNEEWNVYRRYSQFTEFHKELKKQYNVVSSISLPPKKTIGNKGANFVEERRKKLQIYLRQIMNFLITINRVLANSPNKYKLVNLVPFFSEQYNQSFCGKRSWLNLSCLMPQNSVVDLNTRSQPHYTGL